MAASGAIVLAIFTTLFWGASFEAVRIALQSLPPWTACAERFFVATAVIFAFLFASGRCRWSLAVRNAGSFLWLGVIGIAGFNGALFYGLQTSEPVTASLIMGTTPISASIIESLIHRRAPGPTKIIGMLVSLLGVALVVTEGQWPQAGDTRLVVGDVVVLGGSVAWALYTVGCREYVVDSSPLETTSWTMLIGATVLLALAFILEDPVTAVPAASASSHGAVMFLAICATVLAYLFWTIAIEAIGPTSTAMFFNLVPVFALLVEWYFGSVPGLVQWLGVALTITGVALGNTRAFPRPRFSTVSR